jgi:hypothetical protein
MLTAYGSPSPELRRQIGQQRLRQRRVIRADLADAVQRADVQHTQQRGDEEDQTQQTASAGRPGPSLDDVDDVALFVLPEDGQQVMHGKERIQPVVGFLRIQEQLPVKGHQQPGVLRQQQEIGAARQALLAGQVKFLADDRQHRFHRGAYLDIMRGALRRFIRGWQRLDSSGLWVVVIER